MLATAFKTISRIGVVSSESNQFNDKLIARNQFSLLSAMFSLTYVYFFYKDGLVLPLICILISILLFGFAIVLNKLKSFLFSKIIILLATNFSVLFTSFFFGIKSGFHLYLMVSPLIVFVLFELDKKIFLILSILSYIADYIFINCLNSGNFILITYSENQYQTFYTINFLFAITLLITLLLYFLYNNNKVSKLLAHKNEILILQQDHLQHENAIRQKTEEKLTLSLKEKDVLLSEIHHRVKNNLAIVSALLELQGAKTYDTKIILALKESQNRIKSIALLHEKLYESKTLEKIDIRGYFDDLANHISQTFFNTNKDIRIHTQIDPIQMNMKDAMPFALLINELITNSYKHAFNEKDNGNIYITLINGQDQKIFTYKDDGKGLSEKENQEHNSIGMSLIESFILQLKGKSEIASNNGFLFKLWFR
jgi:two-component sensor histidine kinase